MNITQMYNAQGVKQERSGWRDQEISERHRFWGFNCPSVDLDFLMLEYNHRLPVALIEYKHAAVFNNNFNVSGANYKALAALATGYSQRPLPFFVAFYQPGNWFFFIKPVNQAAKSFFDGLDFRCITGEVVPPGENTQDPSVGFVSERWISEQWFVFCLYRLRKAALDSNDLAVIGRLNDGNGSTVAALGAQQ